MPDREKGKWTGSSLEKAHVAREGSDSPFIGPLARRLRLAGRVRRTSQLAADRWVLRRAEARKVSRRGCCSVAGDVLLMRPG